MPHIRFLASWAAHTQPRHTLSYRRADKISCGNLLLPALLLQHTRTLLEKDRRRGLWKACSRRGTPPSSKSKILMETSAASVARHPEERALRRSWNVNLILVISHPPSFSKAVLGLCRSRPILPLRDPLFQFAHLRSACVEVTQSLKWYKVSSPRIH